MTYNKSKIKIKSYIGNDISFLESKALKMIEIFLQDFDAEIESMSDMSVVYESDRYTLSFHIREKIYLGVNDIHKDSTEKYYLNITDKELIQLRRKNKIKNILEDND